MPDITFIPRYINFFVSCNKIETETETKIKFRLGIWRFKPICMTFTFPTVNTKTETFNIFNQNKLILTKKIDYLNEIKISETDWEKPKEEAKCQN